MPPRVDQLAVTNTGDGLTFAEGDGLNPLAINHTGSAISSNQSRWIGQLKMSEDSLG